MKKAKVFTALALMMLLMGTTAQAGTVKTTANLNMRTGPAVSYSRLLTIPNGREAESLSVATNGWHQVNYQGKTGYVSGKYVKDVIKTAPKTVPSTGTATNTVRVSANLNMRAGTSTAHKILLTIPKGRDAEYISTASNGWYQVRYSGKTGYVSNRYSKINTVVTIPAPAPVPVVVPAPAPTPVVTPAPAPTPVVEAAQLTQVKMYYTTANLNMRNGVGTKNAILTNIPKGTHLQSQGVSGGWHKVSYAGRTGWVSGSYLGSGDVWVKDGVIIANKGYGMSSSFNPGENPEAKAKLNAFVAAGRKTGHSLSVFSGFRTYTYQKGLYNRYAAKDGVAKADTYSARPGHSEHTTGLAFDIGAAGITTSTKLGTHPAGVWMAQNANKYGFVLSYPEGKTGVTGYQYEPWHFRYVGVDMATKVYQSGQTLDEYLGTVSPQYK